MLEIQSNDTRQIIMRFEDFFRSQKLNIQIKYLLKIGRNKIQFLYEDLQNFDSQLAILLRNRPENTLEVAVSALKNILKGYLRGNMTNKDYFVSVTTKVDKCPLKTQFHEIRSKNLGKLVIIDGIVIYCASSELIMKNSKYIHTQLITLREIQKGSCITHKRNVKVLLFDDMVDTIKKGQEMLRFKE